MFDERHEKTKAMKNLIDDMLRDMMKIEDLSVSDMLNTDPQVLMMLGYCGKMMDLAYDTMDDMYRHYESEKELNEKILKELERVNRKLEYQEGLIKEIKNK